MIFFFPGQMKLVDIAGEVLRIIRVLDRKNIDTIANMAIHFDTINDRQLVELYFPSSKMPMKVLHVPNLAIKQMMSNPHDPLDDMELSSKPAFGVPLEGSEATRMEGIFGPYRTNSFQQAEQASVNEDCDGGVQISYIIADLIASAWRMTRKEAAHIFHADRSLRSRERRSLQDSDDHLVAVVKDAMVLQNELCFSLVDDYAQWFRVPWQHRSPIGPKSPAEALISGGRDRFELMANHLKKERLSRSKATA